MIKSNNKFQLTKNIFYFCPTCLEIPFFQLKRFEKGFDFVDMKYSDFLVTPKKNDFEDQYGMVGAFNLQTAYIQCMPYNYINKPDLFNSGFINYLKDNF